MRLLVLSVFLLFFRISYSQNITGSWYGKADAMMLGSNNNYLTELIIKQKGDEIEGLFGYYFKDGYKSFFVRGKIDKKTKTFAIRRIPVTYFRSINIDGVDCIMDFFGTIIASKVQTTIKGLLTTDPKYSYTCPEMKVVYTLDNNEYGQDSIIKNSISRKLWQPRKDDIVVNNEPVINPVTPVKKDPVVVKDTIAVEDIPLKILKETFEKRATVLSKEIEIESDSVRISFYDNGDIDGDSISVFLNKNPILTGQELTAQALNIYIKLDPSKDVNELSMFAENLGKYPPNTALMVVNDGEHRYEIYLSSSLTQNASVRLKRKKK
ncbi:MAG: hypothetical protein ABIN89_11615 [Chitinophagaceae bacterium]